MIVDYITNIKLYSNSPLYKFLTFIASKNWEDVEVGKYKLEEESYYSVDELTTKETSKGFWESHIKYTDIHYVVHGKEIIGYENITKLETNLPYNKDKDLITYHGKLKSPIVLEKGMFIILFPNDAHMPNIYVDAPEKMKKLVFKIKHTN